MKIDLRSDTFTTPTPGMLEAMFKAPVGDDVFGEDPSVNKLEQMTADIFGMEAGLFCVSGTMANQVAIKTHTQPGNEVICDKLSHVYIYEAGGIAFNSGCQVKPIDGNLGRITAEQVEEAINPIDIHKAKSTLVSLENTANRGGGSCYNFIDIQNIKAVCSKYNLSLHLDGARLYNALVHKNETPKQYGEIFNSISVCLSKGLGAPVGSILLGTKEYIKQARQIRKIFGGGLRQAGYLAAAGIYAIENHVDKLKEDHEHAKQITAALRKKDFIGTIIPVETNIIIFEVKGRFTPKALVEHLQKKDIHCLPISPTQVRMVTHLNIKPEMVNKIIQIIDLI
ncbi:threonine aldolase family protein [Ferruginibacter albus]|uniref:threonine aldolase family protein n=1 Tax=Ferruginibacter albus TaxID=2875540 RepID=UPI001CC6DC14|nr:GntG family PLP-dependent aldolase [Ferruginibacter albus]UAY50721.1 aminotransferase class I/II-fold pyridoxal phosphate-dependent enzyme [Ferruginibacter albus]